MHPSRLGEAERRAFLALLAERPLVAVPAWRPDSALLAIVALVGAIVFAVMLASALDTRAQLRPIAIAGGLALAATVTSVVWLAVRRAGPVPNGRYLYGWGYVEVDGTRVRFVPGTELRVEHTVGRLASDGTSLVSLRITDGRGLRVTLRFRDAVALVPWGAIDALGTARLGDGGYRDAAQQRWPGVPPRPSFARPLLLAAGVTTALLGTTALAAARGEARLARAEIGAPSERYAAWRAAAREVPLPWVRSRVERELEAIESSARSRLEREVRSPYREALAPVLEAGDVLSSSEERCTFGPRELTVLAGFARRRATDPVPSLTWASPGADPGLDAYVAPVRRSPRWRQPVLRFGTSCYLEPTGMRADPPRSAFRLRGRWTLRDRDAVVVERTLVVEPERIASIAACARSSRSRPDAELRAAAALFGRAVHRDVFVDGRGRWDEAAVLDGFEELAPCVDAALRELVVTDVPALALAGR